MEANARVLQKDSGLRATDGINARAGHSYREFDVAASTLPVDIYNRDIGEVLARGNIKARNFHPKLCAEFIVESIMREKMSHMRASGWIVEATSEVSEISEVSPFRTPTLQPCEDLCAPMLETSPVSGIDTPVITVADNRTRFQVFTAGQFAQAYREEDEALLQGNVAAGVPNFEKALHVFNKIVAMSERWKNTPTPGEMASGALLQSAA